MLENNYVFLKCLPFKLLVGLTPKIEISLSLRGYLKGPLRSPQKEKKEMWLTGSTRGQ